MPQHSNHHSTTFHWKSLNNSDSFWYDNQRLRLFLSSSEVESRIHNRSRGSDAMFVRDLKLRIVGRKLQAIFQVNLHCSNRSMHWMESQQKLCLFQLFLKLQVAPTSINWKLYCCWSCDSLSAESFDFDLKRRENKAPSFSRNFIHFQILFLLLHCFHLSSYLPWVLNVVEGCFR